MTWVDDTRAAVSMHPSVFLKKSNLFNQIQAFAKEIQHGDFNTLSNIWTGSLASIFVFFSHQVKNYFQITSFSLLSFPQMYFSTWLLPRKLPIFSEWFLHTLQIPVFSPFLRIPVFSLFQLYLLTSCKLGYHEPSSTVPVSNRICKVGSAPPLNPMRAALRIAITNAGIFSMIWMWLPSSSSVSWYACSTPVLLHNRLLWKHVSRARTL